MNITSASMLGLALWLAALGVLWFAAERRRTGSAVRRALGWTGVVLLAFLARGLFGEASAALPAMAALAAGLAPLQRYGRIVLLAVILASLALYVSALGFVTNDFYASGYFPRWNLIPLAAAAMVAFFCVPVLAWAWLVGLALFAFGLHPSPNLWDALIDLPSVLVACVVLVRRPQSSAR